MILALLLLLQESQVGDLRARHEAGQTILTWAEVDSPLPSETVGVAELRKLREKLDQPKKIRYRIYRSEQPIESVKDLVPIAEAPPLTGWNADYYGVYAKPEHKATRYVVEEGKGPVPPGTGIYAHNPAAAGKAYYAVTVSVNGEERTALSPANVLRAPLEETVGPGVPILQRIEKPRTANYVPNPELHYYVRWEAPPRSNVPSRPFDYRVGIPPNVGKPAAVGLHLHCWGANLDDGYLWWYRGNEGAILVSSNQIPYDWWVAYHDQHGITKGWKDGVTRDYTPKRLFAFLDWVATKWSIDPQRVFVTGASMGGSGAGMLAVRYPDRFAYALSSVGVHIAAKSPQFKASYEGVCGKIDQGIPHESGLKSFDYLDNAFLLRKDPARSLPFISFANGKNDGAIGWAQAVEFARALQETRQPHLFTWGQGGHGERVYVPTVTGGGDGGPELKGGTLDLRLDQSLPAFTRCSLDDDPGSGDPADGASKGQFNRYLRWDPADVVDETGRWEVTAYLVGQAPTDACTVDVTPRRCRRFTPKPGEKFSWTAGAASGEAVADASGLVTLGKVPVTRTRGRISIAKQATRGQARVEVTRPSTFPHRIWAACDFEGRTPDYAWFGPAETKNLPVYPGNATALACEPKPYGKVSALMTGINPVPGPCMGKVNSLYLRYFLKGATEATFQHFSLSSNDNNHIRLSGLQEGKWAEATMCFSRDGRRNDGTPGVPFKEGERMDDLKIFVGKPGDGKPYELIVDDLLFFAEDPALPPEPEPFPNRVIFLAAFDTGNDPKSKDKYYPGAMEIPSRKETPAGSYWNAAKAVPR
jgi:pimeloyl-ACP methyl ester carboxylesterase